jgi:hypothetical protein
MHKMVQSMVHQYALHYSIRSYVHLSIGIVVYISIFSDILFKNLCWKMINRHKMVQYALQH